MTDIEQVLSDSLEQKRSGDVLYAGGSFQDACDTYDTALSKLQQLENLDEESQRKSKVVKVFLLQSKAACMHRMKRFEEAVQACDAALECDPSNEKALLRRAQCHMEGGSYAKAYVDYSAVAALGASMPEAHKAIAALRLNHPEAVEEAEEGLAEQRRRRRVERGGMGLLGSIQRAAVLVLSTVLGGGWWVIATTLSIALVRYAREDRTWEVVGEGVVASETSLLHWLLVLGLADALMSAGEEEEGKEGGREGAWREPRRSLLLDRLLSNGVWFGVLGLAPQVQRSGLLFLLLLLALWAVRAQLRYPLRIVGHVVAVPGPLLRGAALASLLLQLLVYAAELTVVGKGWAVAHTDLQSNQAQPWVAYALNAGMIVYPVLAGYSFHCALRTRAKGGGTKKSGGARKTHAS